MIFAVALKDSRTRGHKFQRELPERLPPVTARGTLGNNSPVKYERRESRVPVSRVLVMTCLDKDKRYARRVSV